MPFFAFKKLLTDSVGQHAVDGLLYIACLSSTFFHGVCLFLQEIERRRELLRQKVRVAKKEEVKVVLCVVQILFHVKCSNCVINCLIIFTTFV